MSLLPLWKEAVLCRVRRQSYRAKHPPQSCPTAAANRPLEHKSTSSYTFALQKFLFDKRPRNSSPPSPACWWWDAGLLLFCFPPHFYKFIIANLPVFSKYKWATCLLHSLSLGIQYLWRKNWGEYKTGDVNTCWKMCSHWFTSAVSVIITA